MLTDIVKAIEALGFPVAVCLGLGWALFRKDQNSVSIEVYRRECERADRLEKSLDANTTAVERVADSLDSFKISFKGFVEALGGKSWSP